MPCTINSFTPYNNRFCVRLGTSERLKFIYYRDAKLETTEEPQQTQAPFIFSVSNVCPATSLYKNALATLTVLLENYSRKKRVSQERNGGSFRIKGCARK